MRNGSTGRAAALGVLGVVLLAVAAMGAVPTPISAWGPKAAFPSVGVDQEVRVAQGPLHDHDPAACRAHDFLK